jgi:uncharacterized membrane protein YgcG
MFISEEMIHDIMEGTLDFVTHPNFVNANPNFSSQSFSSFLSSSSSSWGGGCSFGGGGAGGSW